MNIFGSSDTVDGKARSVLGDLPGDPSPYEIFRSVDQKAGEDVDPDEVVSTMRDLDDEVDTKLSDFEDEIVDAKLADCEDGDIDQKELRAAASTVADRTDMSPDDAVELFTAVARGDVDQAALTDITDSNMGNDSDTDDTTSGTDTQPPADDGGVDQKQDDDDDGDGGGGGPLDMLNDDARDAVEEFADLADKDPEECVQEVLGAGNDGDDGGVDMAADDGNDGHDRQPGRSQEGADQMDYDQKLEELDINERVADAVTSDEVIGALAGEVSQKLIDDDELADNLVETVDQKGDFATTDDTITTAPSNDSETVGDASPITGGDDE